MVISTLSHPIFMAKFIYFQGFLDKSVTTFQGFLEIAETEIL